MRRRRMLVYLSGAIVGVAVLAVWLLGSRFESTIDGLRDRVLAVEPLAGAPDLPPIVRDFALRAGGKVGGPNSIHLRHQATLITEPGRPAIGISADQWLSTTSPEFVWRGRGTMMGLPVTVVDSMVAGEGLLEARIFGLAKVAGGTGADFAKGELQRYLSELPVHPDAILNNVGLRWRQLDARTVEVSAWSAYGKATATMTFDENGDIVGLEAPDRPMTVGQATIPTVWRGTFSRYERIGAYRIPTYGEVGWLLPDGLFTYWKGEIVAYEPL